MLYEGSFSFKGKNYQVSIIEGTSITRTDIFIDSPPQLVSPVASTVAVSVLDDFSTGEKIYSGDLDLYYALERVQREARLYQFEEREVETSDDFEEGKVIFICKQKSERFEYNYKSENRVKIFKEMRTPEASLTVNLIDENYNLILRHVTLSYETLIIDAPEFNEDSVILSRMATMQELREKYDLSWMKNKDYRWVNNLDELREYVRECMSHPYLVAIDTETTGLNVYYFPEGSDDQDKIVCIVFTWKKDFAVLVPLSFKYEQNLPFEEAMQIMQPVIETAHNVTQNGTFDYKTFLPLDLHLNIDEDTLMQLYTLEPNPKKGSKSLKNAIMKYFGIKQLSLTDIFLSTKEGKMEIRFDLLPKDLALFYACPDVDLLLSLYERLKEEINTVSQTIYKTEVKLMPVMADAEYTGLRVDMKKFAREMKMCQEVIDKLEATFFEIAGYKFNLNSPDQVGKFLYDKLGCQKIIVSKSDPTKGSTSAKALEFISDLEKEVPTLLFRKDITQQVIDENGKQAYNKDGTPVKDRVIIKRADLNKAMHPAVLILRKFRDYTKLMTSFFRPIDEKNRGGWLFNWINQTGAATGRIISPFQTLPEFIKDLIIPDSEEHGFLVVDFKQIELRIMYGLAKEMAMVAAAENPDNDLHRVAAGNIYNLQLWQINSKMRKEAKALNFGIPYDLGNYRLAANLFGLPVTEEKVQKAMEARARFYKAMPRVERMFIDIKDKIREYGCFYTMFGRGHFYENILYETDKGKRARILRQGNNVPIQGFCADYYKIGLVELEERFKKRGWAKRLTIHNSDGTTRDCRLVRMAQFVHDEILIPYHKKSIHVAQVLYEVKMALQKKLKSENYEFPTFYIGAAVSDTWGEGKQDKFEMPARLLQQICDEVEAGMHTEPISNPKEWMLNRIAEFKENDFKEYFEELKANIAKEGLPVTKENIAKRFRHDVLTHDVMAMFKTPEDYHVTIGRPVTHEDQIEYAVMNYIDAHGIALNDINEIVIDFNRVSGPSTPAAKADLLSLLAKPTSKPNPAALSSLISPNMEETDSPYVLASEVIEDEVESDYGDKVEWIGMADSLDDFGNPFDVKDRDYFENDYEMDEFDEAKYSALTEGFITKADIDEHEEKMLNGYSNRILTVARRKIINVDLINTKALIMLRKVLEDSHRADGLYDVYYRLAGKQHDTGFKADKLDEVFIDLLLSKTEAELDQLFAELG